MKTLLIYTSKHGTTASVADMISTLSGKETIISKLSKSTPSLFNDYERIIIGTSIHAGQIPGRLKKFLVQHADTLSKKELGLYLCCMHKGEEAQKQFETAFPKLLRNSAKAKGILGGEFLFEKMNFIEKAIIKKIAKTDQSVSAINQKEIEKFITLMYQKI